MSELNMAVPHSLQQDEAVSRIKNLFNDVKIQFAEQIRDLHEEWEGNTGKFNFSAMGFPISGTLTVTTSQVEISGNLPSMIAPFKGKIESMIKVHAEKLLA